MYLTKWALLFTSASAAAFGTNKASSWEITKFSSSHVPHGDQSVTSFDIQIPGIDPAHCKFSKVTRSSNTLAKYENVECDKNSAIEFSQIPIHNEERSWIFSVMYKKDLRSMTTSTSFFESPKGSGFTYQKLDLPDTFKLTKD